MNGLFLLVALASASPEPALTVVGAGAAPMALSLDDLKALGKLKATWKEHGTDHTLEGVPLSAVLKHAGVTPGDMKGLPPKDKRAGYKKVVVAGAPDCFQAVFSVAELDKDIGQTRTAGVECGRRALERGQGAAPPCGADGR
jgi:hypothetical protein